MSKRLAASHFECYNPVKWPLLVDITPIIMRQRGKTARTVPVGEKVHISSICLIIRQPPVAVIVI